MKTILYPALACLLFTVELHAQDTAKPSQEATPKKSKIASSSDQALVNTLKVIELLPSRDAIQNPQAAELWHMKEKADRLAGEVKSKQEHDELQRLVNRITRQLQIAVNLPPNVKIANGKPAQPGQIPYQVALVFTGYPNPVLVSFAEVL